VKSIKNLVLLLSIALFGIGVVSAQTSKGILAGTVRDQTGAAVPNATVTVTSQETGETRTATSNSQGSYRVEAINPGLYSIHAALSGFSAVDVKDLAVTPSIVTTYDPKLSIGNVDVNITVEANTNAINTEGGTLSGTIDALELAKVPIFSLNPFELVATLPGVQLVNPALGLAGIGGNFEQLVVNGARPRSNNFMLDGQDINDVGIGGQSFDPQVPDMYQSTAVILNSASAEFGRSGGAVVNLITKGGTNHFHGTVFELYSGSGLNALDGQTRKGKPYDLTQGNPKARFDQHQFGFTAGGPIWKEKLFAFGGTQFSRFYGKSTSGFIELPDAAGYAQLTAIGGPQVALLQGLLNNGSYLKQYTNLSAGQGSVEDIPISPRPGCTAGCVITTANFQRPPVAQQQPDTQWTYRIDFIPRPTDTFTFRYLHDRSNFTPDLGLNSSGLPGFDGQVGGPAELAQGTWTHVFTPHLLNEFRLSEVRLADLFDLTPEAKANPQAKIFNVNFLDNNIPALGISQNIPQGRQQELYQFQDTVGWVKGRHSIRTGIDLGRDLEIDLVAQNALGGLNFNAGGPTPTTGLSSVDNFLDNRLGTSGFAQKTFGPTRVDPHLWKIGSFIQDDIKLTADLTINLGLRYDYMTVPDNVLQYPSVNPNNPFAPINTVIPVKADKNNFGPRFGFAFNPHAGIFADGKTVFHGGIGVFYDTDFTNILINSAQSSPNAPTSLAQSTVDGGLTNATGLFALMTPVLDPLNSSVLSITSNLVNPITYQYNFGFERQLPAQIKLTMNYVGARGEKLFSNRQLNYFGGFGQTRLNPTRNAINIRDNRGDSHYDSGQVEVTRSYKSLLFRASYAFGKDLDDASEVFATFASPTSYSSNLAGNALGQDYGHSAFDRQHVASFEYVYSPTGFHSNNSVADGLLSAFTRHFIISGTTQFSSGPYSSFNLSGRDTNGDGSSANDRPLIGNPNAPITTAGIDGAFIGGTAGTYYDLAAYNQSAGKSPRVRNPVSVGAVHFLVPRGAQFTGQAIGRNSFENPGQQFWNAALEKDIPARFTHLESGQFVLRVEGQNVGNHNNVSTLDNNVLNIGKGTSYLDRSSKREGTNQSFRLWAKFIF